MKIVVAVGLTGVLAAGSAAQAPRTRDSAGVRIIENGPRLSAPVVFQLADKPSFDVGGLQQDPSDELTPRNPYPRAVRLANGNVAVLDRIRVMFFDATGKRTKVAGREGRGPGEFTHAADICATRGDTVIVTQERSPMTRLTKDGEFISTAPLPTGLIAEGHLCFDDGTYFLMTRLGGAGTSSAYRFLRVGPTGVMNTIADQTYPPFDMLVMAEQPKTARGSRLYLGTTEQFEIRAFDVSGKLAEIIRTSDPLRPMTDDDKSAMPLLAYRAGSSQAERDEARQRAISNSKTRHWPTIGKMLVDAAGRIWVEDWAPAEDPTKDRAWTAFDASGRLIGRMIVPGTKSIETRRHVVHFGKDEVIFFRIDDDGAAHYTAYPIRSLRR